MVPRSIENWSYKIGSLLTPSGYCYGLKINKIITINEAGEERRDRNQNLEAISSSVQCCAQSHYTVHARGIFTESNISIGKGRGRKENTPL